MTSKRLEAYQVMRRVARVKEVRASLALSEAVAAETRRRAEHDRIAQQRDAVAMASHGQRTAVGNLDMGRYEMLCLLGEAIDERLGEAASALSSASELSRERATASASAQRRRESIDEHVEAASRTLEQVRSGNAREEAVELWLRGKSR